jgi:hypothetical protein
VTQYRRDPDRESNYFDRLLRDIGPRGSSFTDVDALTHDERTDRFLFQEFKGPAGQLNRGQSKVLAALARRDYITVWCVRRRGDGLLDWCDVLTRAADRISPAEYRERFCAWWQMEPIIIWNPATQERTPIMMGRR